MLKELLKPEIKELIEKRQWTDLKDCLKSWAAPEISDLLLDIDQEYRAFLFRALPRDLSTDVFTGLEYEQRDELLHNLTDQETRLLLADMPPDDRTELLEELPAKATKRMLNLLNPEDLKEARFLLGYPEDSIGRQMTPDFVAIRKDWTITKALNHIREFGRDSETINRIYITDDKGKLLDDILLRNIILANENETISNLMDYNFISLSAFDDQEEAVRTMDRYDISALPVVDSSGYLVGIVTFDDILDISEEEATEDFHKISAINPVEQSYLAASGVKLWAKRYPWLLGLLLVNFITAWVLGLYNHANLLFPTLSNFIPMLMGTAGNSGSQSSTLIIRSLATKEVRIGHWSKILLKEMRVAIMLGASLGLFTLGMGLYNGDTHFDVAIVLSFSLVIILLWANIIGGLLPIALARLKFDPAVISSPLISTITDISSIVLYYNIAIWYLS